MLEQYFNFIQNKVKSICCFLTNLIDLWMLWLLSQLEKLACGIYTLLSIYPSGKEDVPLSITCIGVYNKLLLCMIGVKLKSGPSIKLLTFSGGDPRPPFLWRVIPSRPPERAAKYGWPCAGKELNLALSVMRRHVKEVSNLPNGSTTKLR